MEWWGFRDDVKKILAQSSIVVLPSYREGMPKILQEAAACGRPVITTDVPGCREVIKNGETGLLVDAKSASALAAAIGVLLRDKVLRKKMGKAGRSYAELNFNVDDVVSQHIALYNSFAD